MSIPVVMVETPNQIKRMNLDSHKAKGKVATQADRVLVAISRANKPITRSELAKALNIPMASVCGRVNTLFSDGYVEPVGSVECPVTGRTAHGLACTAKGKKEAEDAEGRVAHASSSLVA